MGIRLFALVFVSSVAGLWLESQIAEALHPGPLCAGKIVAPVAGGSEENVDLQA